MNVEMLTALAAFALVSSITPGPNNLMLMSSGATFGLKRTVPHLLGVGIGMMIMLALMGLGLMQLFDAIPMSHQILKVFSVAYLLFLAYKIATSAAPEGKQSAKARPFTFFQAALFQWVNPKAWTMALTAISVYAPDRSLQSLLILILVFALVNFPSVGLWAGLGQQLRKVLTSQRRLRAFNLSMASLLVVSLVPVISPDLLL